MAAKGYAVIAVNPNATRLLGRPAWDTLTEVPDAVDMVMFFRPSELVGPFVEEAMLRSGRPALWLQQGIRADAEVSKARDQGHVCVQDLCIFRVHRALNG
jgi:predicted CoA-binding protein